MIAAATIQPTIPASANATESSWLGKVEIADVISFLALAVSLWVAWRQSESEKQAPFKSDVLQNIRDLKEASTVVSDLIADHLTFSKSRVDKEVIYKHERKARAESASLERRLKCRKDEIFRQYTAWWNTSSLNFPIEVKTQKLGLKSAEISAIETSLNSFHEYLDSLTVECHKSKFKIQ